MVDIEISIVTDWMLDFSEHVRVITRSTKPYLSFNEAMKRSVRPRTPFDKVMLDYLKFINTNPLKDNDYFKYVDAYRNGKKLNLKYFRHCTDKLNNYYKKIDADSKYNPFNIDRYNEYVLFMMLKLNGVYKSEYNAVFRVLNNGHREYSPITRIAAVLRCELPFRIKEYDIFRAYPTFIDSELNIQNRKQDVYTIMSKKSLNTLFNMHHEVKDADINIVRKQLEPIYGNRVNEVITEKRFNNKGQMFRDMEIYEEHAINDFVKANNVTKYVRLHDGIFVKHDVQCEHLEFDTISFKVKECVKPECKEVNKTFYSYNKNGELITTPKMYSVFFAQEKFIRVREENIDRIVVVKNDNNVLTEFSYKTETVQYLINHINEFCTDEIENRIARDINNAIPQGYLLLQSKQLEYYTDSKNTFGLSFKNAFVQYDKAKGLKFKYLKYTDVGGFFAPHRTQSHTFKEDDGLSEFEVILNMFSVGKDIRTERLTKSEKKIAHEFCKMFGYMCYSYKDPAFNPAIILSDAGADDINRNGGRGKTIFVNALKEILVTMIKGGREFNPSYIHNYADLKSFVRVYGIDDVPAGFKYDDLYTNIVGSISCQRKGTEAIEIPFNKAPKFIITTNWSVRYDEANTSDTRRFFEYKFTDYFNINNTPVKVLGHSLFSDWNDSEWNLFYNFVFGCVTSYLNEGLERIEYDKAGDNFKAYFSNDTVLNEFERIFNIVKNRDGGFKVDDFLNIYNAYDNPARYEKHFHSRNLKGLVNIYIKHQKLNINYSKRNRKWVTETKTEPAMIDF